MPGAVSHECTSMNLSGFSFVGTPRCTAITDLSLIFKLKDCLTLACNALQSNTCLGFIVRKIHTGVLFVLCTMQKHSGS